MNSEDAIACHLSLELLHLHHRFTIIIEIVLDYKLLYTPQAPHALKGNIDLFIKFNIQHITLSNLHRLIIIHCNDIRRKRRHHETPGN